MFEVAFVKSFMKIVLKFAFSYAKPYRTEWESLEAVIGAKAWGRA
jgi:hypothetical protein